MRKHIHRAYRKVCDTSPQMKRKIRIAYATLLGIAILSGAAIVMVAEIQLKRLEEAARIPEAPPFPISVNPQLKTIFENPEVDTYFAIYVSSDYSRNKKISWLEETLEKIAISRWFQQLASPVARVLVIYPGERKEEIAEEFGDILKWDEEEEARFVSLVDQSIPNLDEGVYFPGRYLTHKDATPEEIASLVTTEFTSELLKRYPEELAAQIPLKETLILASILEREAYDFTDMREISGIIWNRLFIDMNLQLDATLQYAKAEKTPGVWWPQIVPKDKYIESPFNTYENEGLPPAPIANPSLDAVLAALNPIETNCMFYFHDDNSNFHCSVTYEEHVELLKQYYGQGR
ncbi:endolytic transglycosylase MltG [Patescibacteria group bacterium]|nr:endolytic transglycosylase MltG [Patescibacteria group bacterium]